MEHNTGTQQNQTFPLSVNCHHLDKTVDNPEHYRDGFKTQVLTIDDLAEAVLLGHAWSCATYDHSMRSKANYQQAQLIGLDIDNGLTLDDALNHPFVKKYGQLIYTSASHQKPKGDTPPCDRFRIVFNASQPIKDIDTYEQLVKAVMGHFPSADEACKDASRYWAGNSQAEIFILDGQTLPDSLIDEAKKQAKIEWEAREKRRIETLARVNEQNPDELKTLALEALNFIPPRQPGTGTYEESLRVLMALTTIFGPTEAITIAESWSPPMKGWNPARKIQGFRVGEVTAGTLFWIAQQHGFKFPEKQWHSLERYPIEPDADLYQAYVEWEIEQEKNEQAQETSEFINFLKAKFHGLGKHYKKGFGFTKEVEQTKVKLPRKITLTLNDPVPTPEDYKGLEPPIIIFKKGNRKKLYQKLINAGWKHILDASVPGSGKSYDTGNFASENGKHFHITVDHRNPSTPTIKHNFTDLNPRHKGIYQVGERIELKGEKHQLITPSNCSNVDAFNQLYTKNYDVYFDGVNQVCRHCIYGKIKQESNELDSEGNPFIVSKCGAESGEGYGFLHQRKLTLSSPTIRCTTEQLSDVTAYNYSPDLFSIEEAGRTLGTKQITGSLNCFNRQMLDLRAKNRDYFLAIENLLNLRPYLEKDTKRRYGLRHKEILDIIGEAPENLEEIVQFIYNEFNQLDDVFVTPDSTGTVNYKEGGITREQAKTARRGLAIEAREKTLENIKRLPSNILFDLLEVWGGKKGAFKTNQYGEIIITRPDFKMQSILKTSQANLYLDATLTTVKLAALIDIDPTEIITVKQETITAKNNIVVHAVDFSGLGSNNWGRTRNADGELLTKEEAEGALKRIIATIDKLKDKFPEISIYALKKYEKILENHYYWFNHNRGGNHDQGKEAIAAFGKPLPDMGSLESEYITLFGVTEFDNELKPMGFDDYYKESCNQEIIQYVGRQRANLYPDQKFHSFIFAPDLDLTFLKELGYKVVYEDEYQYIPELCRRRKRDKWAILEAAKGLIKAGKKITQVAIAREINATQSWVCKLFGGDEILSWRDFCKIFHSLYKANKETGIITTGTEENATMQEWLGLKPLEVALDMIKAIHNEGWESVVDYLRKVCPHEAFQILGILALFTPNGYQVWQEFFPEVPF